MFVRSIPQSLLNEFKSPWFNWLTSFFGLLQSFQLRRPPCWSRYKINRGGWPNNNTSHDVVISDCYFVRFFLFSVQQTKTRHSIFLYIPTTAAATAIFIFLSTPAATVQCQVPNCVLLNHSGEGKNQFSFWYSRSFYFIISFFDSVTTFADRISLKRAKTLKQFNLFRYSTNTTTTLCSLRGRVTFWESRSNRISCFLSLPVSQLYFWFRKNVFT